MLLALCAPASAKVLLVGADGTVVGLPVRDPFTELVGWTDDGTALLVRRDEHTLRLDLATGATAPQPLLDDAVSVGPGGRAIVPRYGPDGPSVELREADGRVVGRQVVEPSLQPPSAAWSRDGTRVAVAMPRSLLVLDAISGAPVLHTTIAHPELPGQAFAPDGSALLVVDDARVLRVDLPSGHRSVVLHAPAPGIGVGAAWGPDGQVAVMHDDRIRIGAGAEVRVPASYVDGASWTRDGSALTYVFVAASRWSCAPSSYGVGLLAPGGAPRNLVAPSGAAVRAAIWSPDGQTLAVDQDRDFNAASERRGRRHPWPKRIARRYEMLSRRGDAAIRRIVLHASRALRRGAGRAETLGGVSDELEQAAKRFDEAHDTAVEEAIATELDKWLRAAGFATIEARDEFSC